MPEDIRDKRLIEHADIVNLNFIKQQEAYVFRKYYKQGLRSQIMEVLDAKDVLRQTRGEIADGLRQYPWAKPKKILRIFRTKFNSVDDIFKEIKAYKIIEQYLPPGSYSKSCEFVVEYTRKGKRDVLLCGLQDFIDGSVLNPWELSKKDYLPNLFKSMQAEGHNPLKKTTAQLVKRVKTRADRLVQSLKKMVLETGYLPDLAGIGNLILTFSGDIKLVDINNITRISFEPRIVLDDKGYPVSDKSIEAISIMERELLGRIVDPGERLYKTFLDPERMSAVKDLEDKFHQSLRASRS